MSDDMGFWYGCIVIVPVLDTVDILNVVSLKLGAAMLRFLQKVDFDQLLNGFNLLQKIFIWSNKIMMLI